MPRTTRLLATALLFVFQASAEPTLVRVLGSATVQAEPEKAEFFFGVVAYADDANKAAEANAIKTRTTIAALKERLGPDAGIETVNYAIHPNRKYSKRGPEEVTGYSVVNTLKATVGEMSDLGDILDLATAAGADQINSIQFAVKDPSALRAQAFRKAVSQARADAEAIAKALGQRVIRIVAVDDEAAVRERISYGGVTETVNLDGSTPILAGAVQHRASVILTAEVGP